MSRPSPSMWTLQETPYHPHPLLCNRLMGPDLSHLPSHRWKRSSLLLWAVLPACHTERPRSGAVFCFVLLTRCIFSSVSCLFTFLSIFLLDCLFPSLKIREIFFFFFNHLCDQVSWYNLWYILPEIWILCSEMSILSYNSSAFPVFPTSKFFSVLP